MNIETFARELETKGIRLSLRDEKIVCSGSSETLTPDLIEILRQRKPEIREWLQSSLGKDEPTPPPVESTSPDDGPDLDTWRRRIIEREMSTWPPERIQAQEDEIRRIEEFRRTRGPRPSGPRTGIDRAEVFQTISGVMNRLGKIWPCSLDSNPVWQDAVNESATSGDRQTFLDTVKKWEQAETRRVESFMDKIRKTVFGWPDEYRRRFALMAKSFQDGNRGMGFTVRALNHNQAQEKAFNDLKPFIPAREPDTPPAPANGFPFTDLHPHTREILLRNWNTWDAARRARFIEDVRDVMRKTGYSEGNACAFILQTAGPVAPARKPALSPEEKEALHKIMWPTPPSSPQQEPKSTGQDVDIAKIVSRWPKPWRLKYSGLVGKYSNSMPLNQAMEKAYAELQSTIKEND